MYHLKTNYDAPYILGTKYFFRNNAIRKAQDLTYAAKAMGFNHVYVAREIGT